MQESPKISVIVPVYNVEKYLNKCVSSLVNQTYKKLEIILVDDGSPDNCPQMCDDWVKKDDRIKVIHKENGGLSSARNAGLAIAGGNYIGFVDSDDWIDEDMYEFLLSLFDRDSQIDITRCSYRTIQSGKAFYSDSDEEMLADRDTFLNMMFSDTVLNSTCTMKLYKKSAIGEIKFDEQIKIGEDHDFNYKVMQKINYVYCSDLPKYNYVQTGGSITRSIKDPIAYVENIDRNKKIFDCESSNKKTVDGAGKCLAQVILIYIYLFVSSRLTKTDAFTHIRKVLRSVYPRLIRLHIGKKLQAQLFCANHFMCLYKFLLLLKK